MHLRAVLSYVAVLVRPLCGERLRHVHDVLAAVLLGGLCDSEGVANNPAQKLRVGWGICSGDGREMSTGVGGW